MDSKFFISVAGKSGVGKSAFSILLKSELDAELISFDKISHISLQDKKIKIKLKNIFGDEIFNDGQVDRKKLGKIVFNDEKKMKVLNNISQTFMEEYIDDIIQKTQKKYIIFEYALITKMKYFEMSNLKILIEADKFIRFKRLKMRDNVDDSYLEMREKNLPVYDKLCFDEFFENSNDFDHILRGYSYKIAEKIKNTNINN